jgi:cobalt-zinc-cadmium efflux system membrane fusion protein
MKTIYIIIFVLVLTMACNRTEKDVTVQIAEYKPNVVQVEIEKEIPVDENMTVAYIAGEAALNGIFVLLPGQHASVTLSIDGIVKSTSLLPGRYVQKGELLATLENPEFINLQQSYIDACAQCDYLEAEYKRQEILSREEVASQKRFQESRADFLSMQSRKDAAAALLSMLGLSPQTLLASGITPLLEVRAPISGYISNLQMNLGKHISAGEPLCEIIDKNNTLIKLTAYEKDLSRIITGDKIEFRVNGLGDERFSGEIISIGQRVDDFTRSLEVYAKVLTQNPVFRPGMYVYAYIIRN